MEPNFNRQHELDDVTRRRLARLAGMPVDTTKLAAQLRAELHPAPARQRWGFPGATAIGRTGRRALSVAAGIVILALASFAIFESSNNSVLAAPVELVQLHQDVIAGKHPAATAANLAEANRLIALQQTGAPGGGVAKLPPEQVASCCTREATGKALACVVMPHEGRPVTIVVVEGADPCGPQAHAPGQGHGHAVAPGTSEGASEGVSTCRVHQRDGLNMVMTARNGKWACIMSDLPAEKLVPIAEAVRY